MLRFLLLVIAWLGELVELIHQQGHNHHQVRRRHVSDLGCSCGRVVVLVVVVDVVAVVEAVVIVVVQPVVCRRLERG